MSANIGLGEVVQFDPAFFPRKDGIPSNNLLGQQK